MAGGNVSPGLAPIFQQAGQQYGIPPSVLAGIASVETNLGGNIATSSTGANGLMQFEPGTAKSLGVNPMDPRSAIFGAAKLLVQYGYHSDPTRAIGAYNGGPGNPQYGYANQVLSEASRLKGQLGGTSSIPQMPTSSGASPTQYQTVTSNVFDQKDFNAAKNRSIAGQFLQASGSSPWNTGPKGADFGGANLFSKGLLTTTAPNPTDYIVAQSHLQAIAGTTPLSAHPVVQQATQQMAGSSSFAGGFLPKGATYVQGRRDQGRDGQTNPGGPIIAPGDGYVVAVKSDPNGFGPRYPEIHMTTGPYAGRTIYLGHTLAVITSGSFKAGQVISRTGTVPIGNASVPGWFEIGFADSGSPGPDGQPVPF